MLKRLMCFSRRSRTASIVFFTIAFVGAIAITGRDYGPMARAEAEARTRLTAPESTGSAVTGTWWIAALTVATLVGLTFYLMYTSGYQAIAGTNTDPKLFEILGEADPYGSMFSASLLAFVLAVVLTLLTRGLGFRGAISSSWNGAKLSSMRSLSCLLPGP